MRQSTLFRKGGIVLHNNVSIAIATVIAVPAAVNAEPANIAFYASLRIQAESVRPDDRSVLGSYSGFRDAYSRIGFNADYALTSSVDVFAQLELPLDLANGAVQDPWDQEEDIRIAKVGLRGNLGSLSYGQMWMPYYNAIAYPVDMFSTYYSGFATYTVFRRDRTLSYYSPSFAAFSLAAGWSEDNGANGDNRLQLTGSYSPGDTTLSLGMDDLGGPHDARIYGVSLMHTMDSLYIGAKYEVHDSRISSGYGADGDRAINLYAGYTLGKNTFKVMLANVEGYGEDIVHLGMDHQYNDQLKLFAEYYDEEDTAAITEERGGLAETAWNASGGQAFAIGMRYDF
ncbi:MAG: porin [Gammaproteobacteria bacterium]